MRDDDLRTNPDAVAGAGEPTIGRHRVNGTTLYAEVRGDGPAVLLIPGGAEDAEGWRAVAERLHGWTVVTYDRRGTLRSGREDWPGHGSAQHADDAAALLRALGLADVVVFGGSSAGVIAVQLAIRHPTLVRRALVYEPGYLRAVQPTSRLIKPGYAIGVSSASHKPSNPSSADRRERSRIASNGAACGAGKAPNVSWLDIRSSRRMMLLVVRWGPDVGSRQPRGQDPCLLRSADTGTVILQV